MRCLKNLLRVVMLSDSILIMIKYKAHGIFKVLKLLWFNLFDLIIRHLVILDQLIELFCRKVLNFETQPLSYNLIINFRTFALYNIGFVTILPISNKRKLVESIVKKNPTLTYLALLE